MHICKRHMNIRCAFNESVLIFSIKECSWESPFNAMRSWFLVYWLVIYVWYILFLIWNDLRDCVVLTNYRYSSPLFFQERFYLCSSNVCHLLWVFCWLRALYFSCHRKLLHFQVNIKKNVCVQFLTILVFSINPITLQFNFAHTALHHVAYVA